MNESVETSAKEEAVHNAGDIKTPAPSRQLSPCPFAVLDLKDTAGSNRVHSRWLDIQANFEKEGGSEARFLMQAAAASWILNARTESEQVLAEISGWESVGFIKAGSSEHDLCLSLTSRMPRRVIHIGGIGVPQRTQGSVAKRQRALPAAAEGPWQVVCPVTSEELADEGAMDMVLSSPQAYVLWFYFQSGRLHNNWAPYDTEAQDALRRAWMDSSKRVSLEIEGWQYDLDLVMMTQTSVKTGMQRKMSVHSGPADDSE